MSSGRINDETQRIFRGILTPNECRDVSDEVNGEETVQCAHMKEN